MGSQNYTDISHLVKKAQRGEKIGRLLRTSLIWISLVTNFITLSLLIAFYFKQDLINQTTSKELLLQRSQVLGTATVPGLPVRLIIPQINVSANIKHVGVTPEGTMEVPKNIAEVGWFKLGSQPGERGSAVISGHMDGNGEQGNDEQGIFTDLYRLKEGDKVYVEDYKGMFTTFVVRERRTYDPGYADEVFSRSDKAYLNLITCDGVWDGVKKSYSKRLVVFADLAH